MDRFNLKSAFKDLTPVAINEYRMVNSRVAQVVISSMFPLSSRELTAALQERLPQAVQPLAGSFRWLDREKTTAHGFVARVNPCVMLAGKDPSTEGFRLVASNMYLSDTDQSTWELKPGVSGSYMVRQGEDELGELLQASCSTTRSSTRMATIASATASPTEFVSFVNSLGTASPSVDYGFCQASAQDGSTMKLVTSSYDKEITVRSSEIISVHQLDNKEVASLYSKGASRNQVASSAYDKEGSTAYYKKLYAYAPDYLNLVIKEINEMAAL